MNAKQTASTDVAVRSSSDSQALEEFVTILTTGELPDTADVLDDPDAVSREIIASILAADSDDAMFAAVGGNAQGWRDLKGIPVEIRGFRWRPSTLDAGLPVFVIVSAIRVDTGEVVALTTGAANVLAQLANMARRGTLVGAKVKLMEADRETQAGYRPLSLVPAA